MLSRLASFFAFALLAGCGTPAAVPTPQPPPDAELGLRELGEVFKYRAGQKAPAPTRAEDLAENAGAVDNALPLINDGHVVVFWRVSYSPTSTEVLAYQKSAATAGGKVLLRNGTVKEMTAAEFAAAPKAK
ncbi:MAG: hypothetical protein ACKODX_01800 [Gemmata sp.]